MRQPTLYHKMSRVLWPNTDRVMVVLMGRFRRAITWAASLPHSGEKPTDWGPLTLNLSTMAQNSGSQLPSCLIKGRNAPSCSCINASVCRRGLSCCCRGIWKELCRKWPVDDRHSQYMELQGEDQPLFSQALLCKIWFAASANPYYTLPTSFTVFPLPGFLDVWWLTTLNHHLPHSQPPSARCPARAWRTRCTQRVRSPFCLLEHHRTPRFKHKQASCCSVPATAGLRATQRRAESHSNSR